ncbi:MAG: PLP-dependent aspartate aminotransferase family protein [Candidatus Komeilibacteria bacterium]|nr:PLP-dependent aspartate aminotransferase family protein [Candidatus Komeilibacteria bacterium]
MLSSETLINHTGYVPGRSEGAVMTPSFQTTTYEFSSAEAGEEAFAKALQGDNSGELIYSRVNHPNAQILEDRLVCMEPQADQAIVFNSGMAAISTLLLAVGRFDQTIAYTSPLYGGTYEFIHTVLHKSLGVKTLPLSVRRGPAEIRNYYSPIGLLFIETPANPTLHMHDIIALVEAANENNPECVCVLDNTFMGIFQSGFTMSRWLDLIVYSGTKFIGGHSDVLSGCVLGKSTSKHLIDKIRGYRTTLGNILQPNEAQEVQKHLGTYRLRMKKQAENAMVVAEFLRDHRMIDRVLFPLYFTGTQAEIFSKQCHGTSSIISFYLQMSKGCTFDFLNKVRCSHVISLAVSLGGVESLICHPASTTHSEIPEKDRIEMGITDNLVRLSVGLEDPEDLIQILSQALA